MSIYIKNMEMPTSCDTCWALDDYGDYPRCRITEEQRGYNFQIRENRMDKCPLVLVPEHGRCIDADVLTYAMGMDEKFSPLEALYLMGLIADAPTIIEAEESK